jgi:hypothetical protein
MCFCTGVCVCESECVFATLEVGDKELAVRGGVDNPSGDGGSGGDGDDVVEMLVELVAVAMTVAVVVLVVLAMVVAGGA